MELKFWKIQATGNDFILLDDRDGKLNLDKNQVKSLCERRLGIGADGLIFLRSDDELDFRMVYLNADGNEVDMCGNGTRALTYFYHQLTNKEKSYYKFRTRNGIYESEIYDNYVKVKMSEIYDIDKFDISSLVDSEFSYFLNTGVPHCVFEVSNLKNYPINEKGKQVRDNQMFEEGCNANFFERLGEGNFLIRTFERGVEAETLSCGTGITAVAVALFLNGRKRKVYSFQSEGGAVDIEIKSTEEVFLCGKVKKVYEGSLDLSL